MRLRLKYVVLVSMLGSAGLACSGGEESSSTATTEEAPRVHGLTEEEAAQTLATIGDETLTVGEFAEAIANKGPFLRARYNSPERRRELLDQMIRFELLAQEADSRGYDELPEVVRTEKQIMIRRFLKQEYEDRTQPSDITDEEVRTYYEAHPEEFHQPEQVRMSHILFSSQAQAQRVLRQILANPTDVRLFRSLAEQHNTDPQSRDRFGDVGFFSRPDQARAAEPNIPAEVRTAAFSIATIGGVFAEVVRSDQGFHIIKLTGRRAPLDRSLEEASRPIRHRLFRERREQAIEELVTRLRGEADVQEHLEVLDQLHIDLPEGSFPQVQLPPGADPTRPMPQPTMPESPHP